MVFEVELFQQSDCINRLLSNYILQATTYIHLKLMQTVGHITCHYELIVTSLKIKARQKVCDQDIS